MNELITSHQSGRNSSKAVIFELLVLLRFQMRGALIYLGHESAVMNKFWNFVSQINKNTVKKPRARNIATVMTGKEKKNRQIYNFLGCFKGMLFVFRVFFSFPDY